jgi:hypothetical protein
MRGMINNQSPETSIGNKLQHLLNDHEVARLLQVSVSTVRRWRLFGNQGPRWIRVSQSAIRYRLEDVQVYLETRPSGGEVR